MKPEGVRVCVLACVRTGVWLELPRGMDLPDRTRSVRFLIRFWELLGLVSEVSRGV